MDRNVVGVITVFVHIHLAFIARLIVSDVELCYNIIGRAREWGSYGVRRSAILFIGHVKSPVAKSPFSFPFKQHWFGVSNRSTLAVCPALQVLVCLLRDRTRNH